MAWQDRDYYREGGSGMSNPLMWLLYGSVPLFRLFGIRVRAHASLLLFVVMALVFGIGPGFLFQQRVEFASILFLSVLLHEFGHCFAARWVGGDADEIIMHPLGGLAMAQPPHRPLPTFITVAAGPAVTLLICAASGSALWSMTGWLPWGPWMFHLPQIASYLYFIYAVNWGLLLFNLLPIYPLDGGQMVQTILWPRMGYYRSMNVSCIIGMVAAAVVFPVALYTGNFFLAFIAAMGFMTCFSRRRMLREAGPWMPEDQVDYSASLQPEPHHRRKHISSRAFKRARRRELAEREEQVHVDAILAKVSAHGLQSLTWRERRALRKATERQRDLDLETSRPPGM